MDAFSPRVWRSCKCCGAARHRSFSKKFAGAEPANEGRRQTRYNRTQMRLWVITMIAWSAVANGADVPQIRAIHEKAIGIDSHIDTLQWVMYQDADLSKRHSVYHVDFPRLREGGMMAPYFALYVPTYYRGGE